MEKELATRYDASQIESKWGKDWEEAGLFAPDENSNKPNYVITIPPPNITGSLHMGHALCYPIQDALGRFKRLTGYNVLILPGQDHAGIATQSVVEKMLRKEGTSGAQLGREKFLERVWEWRKESGDTIIYQLKRLGCGFDWSRLRFTLDDQYVKAVLKVFIDWFDRGVIFRGKRVVNWDPVLKTSVSDIETERKLVKGKLYHIRYPFTDGSGHIIIATTRPETMLADVAVAVHPSDKRYTGLVGKTLTLPLVGREIPLIADAYPDPEFGTGAVKITPAHDPNDYLVGVRHNLEMPVVLDESGKVNENGGKYTGLDRLEARKRIVADLEEAGFLEKIEDHEVPLIVSERSGEPIEPMLSEQWFAKQDELAKVVLEALDQGKINFVPERYTRIFREWLENLHDWTLSRQLWWGHRIPVYYAEDGTPVAALSWEDAEAKLGKKIVRQDDDVLDTWFSSGLWPFAVLGWPEETSDLKKYYPTSCLVTSREILYLWVARMAMMGLDFMKEVPFHDVYIYATVLTEDGRRMSKSLGTGVDPLTVIDKVGADALRFMLLSQTGYNQDIRYSEKRSDEARNFANKIWNAVRFVLLNYPQGESLRCINCVADELVDEDKWILSRLASVEEKVKAAYERYHLQEACQELVTFFWSDVCDWYIELSKRRLSNPETQEVPLAVLLQVFEAFVTMLHPIMPHITEEIYHALPIEDKSEYLMTAKWPENLARFKNEEVEAKVESWFEVTRQLRALRATLGVSPGKALAQAFYVGDLQGGESVVSSQAWIENLVQGEPGTRSASTRVGGIDLYIPITEEIDIDKILEKIDKEISNMENELNQLSGRANNPDFRNRAKPEVVAQLDARIAELTVDIAKAKERKATLQ